MSKGRNYFKFKKFEIIQAQSTMKVNTDAILLGSWARVEDCLNILDIGTGTGVIALMVAQRAENAKVTGVEIEEKSFLEASTNVDNSIFANRTSIVHDSIQNFSQVYKESFDHIVSNPPFFTGGTFSSNENKANVRHAIKLSHGDLLNAVTDLLSENGKFSVILPYIEGYRFVELAERSGLHTSKITEVRPRLSKSIERLLIEFTRVEKTKNMDEILIYHKESKNYADDFKALTKDFYLHF